MEPKRNKQMHITPEKSLRYFFLVSRLYNVELIGTDSCHAIAQDPASSKWAEERDKNPKCLNNTFGRKTFFRRHYSWKPWVRSVPVHSADELQLFGCLIRSRLRFIQASSYWAIDLWEATWLKLREEEARLLSWESWSQWFCEQLGGQDHHLVELQVHYLVELQVHLLVYHLLLY